MPKFFYTTRDKTGLKHTGVQDSSSQDELVAWLQAKNLIVVSVELESKRAEAKLKRGLPKFGIKRRHSRITTTDLALFCRQLATLLGAGITILESLDIVLKQVSSQRLYNVIRNLTKNMEAGLSFHEAMAKDPRVFSPLWVNLTESGEASGNLAVVLTRLAGYLERNEEFRNRIVSALIYPAILLFLGISALLFLTIKIIPTFAELFAGFDMELPRMTQILIGVSNFIRCYLLMLVFAIGVIVLLIKRYLKYPAGKRRYERLLFRLPVFGSFLTNLLVERFSSEMSTLVESGVPILYSLEITERSVDSYILADIVRHVKQEVRQGSSLSAPMEDSGFFDPMVVQMVRVGEEIGDLSSMFKKISFFYQQYVETFLVRFTAMFEPIMLVFIGAIIGVLVVGMFLPIFQISKMGM